MAWDHEQIIPTKRPPLVGEVSANFCDRGCQVVSVTDLYSRILGFLDQNKIKSMLNNKQLDQFVSSVFNKGVSISNYIVLTDWTNVVN
jgi:hypothetical protein